MRRVSFHVVLFLLTCFSTTQFGAIYAGGGNVSWGLKHLSAGLSFSLPLMFILLVHEMGHYVAARIHGVPASLPYFIPVPFFLGFGTLGAVIAMKPSRSRNAIVDIGAAGPLAGLVVAIPVVIYGLAHSKVGPIPPGTQFEGNSLLYMVLKRVITGHWLPSKDLDVNLAPAALAGWAGLFVTMLNLLPIGQLDGGHVATGYFGGERYERVSRTLHFVLPAWAVANFFYVTSYSWRYERMDAKQSMSAGLLTAVFPMVWFGLMFLMRRLSGGRYHPPLDNEIPLSPGRRALFGLTAIVFLLIFMPWPSRLGPQ